MKNPIKKYRQIHCVGIGGSGMSALACILKKTGIRVSGSDLQDSEILSKIRKQGIKVFIGHKSKNLPSGTDLVIRSSAIPLNNPEIKEAAGHKIPVLNYAQGVGLLSNCHKTICICGTHGKTTTTAMTAAVLTALKQDPTVIVGSSVNELQNRNYRAGKGKYFVLEACEHFRSFLNYKPQIIILTNVEADHLDYYKDLKDYKSSFIEFINKLPADGILIANGDDKNIRDILKKCRKPKVFLYGSGKNNNYLLKGSKVLKKNKQIAILDLNIPGKHNLMNSAAVISLVDKLGLNVKVALKILNSYKGSARRFELKGIVKGTHIIDDYGHHPTEIAATLKAVREKYGKKSRILCVFQPHQYSRTRLLLNDFAKSFGDATEVIIPNILRVRDTDADVKSITPQKLVQKITLHHGNAKFIHGLDKTATHIKKHIDKYDVVITMGAGDVWKIADMLVS
jgi:UDP-N-acetylmuramate--alanine ligase